MNPGRISQAQIAREAGVSQMTVSNVLKGRTCGKVSPETCRRLQRIISKHNYGVKLNSNAIISRKNEIPKRIILLKATDEKHQKEIDFSARENFYNVQEIAFQITKKYGIKLETQIISKENSAIEIDWEGLKHIEKGDRILINTFWNLHAAVALQKRGCRVAMLSDELFWIDYYAPQISHFAVFIKEERKTFHKIISHLVSSCAKRIAVLGFLPYFYEPEHPLRVCYEQSMGLFGLKYRNAILIDHRENHYRDAIQNAYQEKPFEALILDFVQLPVPAFNPEKTVQENLGLPNNVTLFFSSKPSFSLKKGENVYFLTSVWEQRMEDAVRVLMGRSFKAGFKYYERKIEKL